MKIKIISDGTVHGTEVVNAETGETIEGIVSIEWSIQVKRGEPYARAIIKAIDVPIEFTGNAALELMAAAKEIADIIKEG